MDARIVSDAISLERAAVRRFKPYPAYKDSGVETQIVQGKTVCVVSCQRSPEPVFLKWKGLEAAADGDFFVRSGPGTVKLPPESTQEYIRTRFAVRTPSAPA